MSGNNSNIINFAEKRSAGPMDQITQIMRDEGMPEQFIEAYRATCKQHMELTGSTEDLAFTQRIIGQGSFSGNGITINNGTVHGVNTFIHVAPMDAGRHALMAAMPPVSINEEDSSKEFFSNWIDKVVEPARCLERVLVDPALAFTFLFIRKLAEMAVEVAVFEDEDFSHNLIMCPVIDGATYVVSAVIYKKAIIANHARVVGELRSRMPGYAPVWKDVDPEEATLKLTLTQIKPKSPLFKGQPPSVLDEILGHEYMRPAMEAHLAAMQEWRFHYDVYYSQQGWEYAVKWKEVKPKKRKQKG